MRHGDRSCIHRRSGKASPALTTVFVAAPVPKGISFVASRLAAGRSGSLKPAVRLGDRFGMVLAQASIQGFESKRSPATVSSHLQERRTGRASRTPTPSPRLQHATPSQGSPRPPGSCCWPKSAAASPLGEPGSRPTPSWLCARAPSVTERIRFGQAGTRQLSLSLSTVRRVAFG